MKLYINLIAEYKKNLIRVLMGIVMLGLSFYTYMTPSNTLQPYVPVFIIVGIAYIIIGFGVNPVSFFGKAYLKIDRDSIVVKQNIIHKMWTINWTDVNQIQIKVTSIRFIGNNTEELAYNKMSKTSIIELKTAVIGLAKEKNIELI